MCVTKPQDWPDQPEAENLSFCHSRPSVRPIRRRLSITCHQRGQTRPTNHCRIEDTICDTVTLLHYVTLWLCDTMWHYVTLWHCDTITQCDTVNFYLCASISWIYCWEGDRGATIAYYYILHRSSKDTRKYPSQDYLLWFPESVV